ncbi:MAG TPA: carboxypeptidase-like regulatory domain-containing protein, partial [Pyrinomonadaceae bacterium]
MRREILNRTFVVVCALLLLGLAAPAARAQQQHHHQGATLSGRVTDPQGAGLTGAAVTLHERARTQVRLSAVTDAAGAYRFERLAPGEYIVEAEARGFAPGAAQAVTVGRGASATLD